jgi:hypothetical protein
MIVNSIWAQICNKGGRFLRRSGGIWVEMRCGQSKAKIVQVLTNPYSMKWNLPLAPRPRKKNKAERTDEDTEYEGDDDDEEEEEEKEENTKATNVSVATTQSQTAAMMMKDGKPMVQPNQMNPMNGVNPMNPANLNSPAPNGAVLPMMAGASPTVAMAAGHFRGSYPMFQNTTPFPHGNFMMPMGGMTSMQQQMLTNQLTNQTNINSMKQIHLLQEQLKTMGALLTESNKEKAELQQGVRDLIVEGRFKDQQIAQLKAGLQPAPDPSAAAAQAGASNGALEPHPAVSNSNENSKDLEIQRLLQITWLRFKPSRLRLSTSKKYSARGTKV